MTAPADRPGCPVVSPPEPAATTPPAPTQGYQRPNPALKERHPWNCPDPEWCLGNGCWWDCQGDPDAGVE